ncbi:tRNA pseudouridine(55) synthase TruB [Amnibacterium flavum]|uniref:tRNA pseudouridine synthase B n=1 Tax=Amnibacterium flavum TaxID=2173173 RepID=A0A2V1HU61_9MICO|nr:tRNA pseudouridine(55) synthase TruB [Amnibacterium flavum]PVZ93634.1 tRNA pseudouridine(55) synthase TruB [Amnibacterium flavum]
MSAQESRSQTSATAAPVGILLVDKPEGLTSHGVVARVRRAAGTRKVGHAGTLDPMATGLLVAGIGSATRLLTYFVGLDKQYLATIRLGQSTTTDDREGEALAEAVPAASISDEAIASAVDDLTGEISQVPSSVSAIKVDGQRSYARVRAGEEVVLAARGVTIADFTVLARRDDPAGAPAGAVDLDVRVDCSSGTYIRALARDLGAALGVGGHLTALRRTRVGPFAVADATPLDELMQSDRPMADLIPPARAAARLFATIDLDGTQATDLGNGKKVPVDAADGSPVAAVGPAGDLVALVGVAGGIATVVTGFPREAPNA